MKINLDQWQWQSFLKANSSSYMNCNSSSSLLLKNYQHILALTFAIKEINETPQILPNLTLAFHIYDSYFNAQWTYHTTLLLISSFEKFVPNYSCDAQNNVIAVIGGLDAQTSLHIATLVNTYKIPQVKSMLIIYVYVQFVNVFGRGFVCLGLYVLWPESWNLCT